MENATRSLLCLGLQRTGLAYIFCARNSGQLLFDELNMNLNQISFSVLNKTADHSNCGSMINRARALENLIMMLSVLFFGDFSEVMKEIIICYMGKV